MPLYEYQCGDCGQISELLIRSNEAPVCSGCAGTQMTKQLSLTAAPKSSANSLPTCGPAPMPGGG